MTKVTAAANDVVHNPRLSGPRTAFDQWPPTRRDATYDSIAAATGRHAEQEPSRLGIILLALELILASAAAAAPNLSSVVIRGSTVYDAPALFDVYREQLGKPVTAEGARAIVTALLQKYEADGYSRPQAKLDDALLEVGVLRIDASGAAHRRGARQRRSRAASRAARDARHEAARRRPRHASGNCVDARARCARCRA